MKLLYYNLDLATLGTLRVVGRETRREPVESPQRERVEYRVRLDFFLDSFQGNFNQIQQLQGALANNNAVLTWQDDTGGVYVNRTVTAGDDKMMEDVLAKGGTRWQAIEFSFWYYNYTVATNCLGATWTAVNSAAQDMGAVETWSEGLDATRFSPLHDPRRLVTGAVAATGRWQQDTTQSVGQRQAALQAKKDTLIAQLVQGASGTWNYGTFNQVIRVVNFKADVNQPKDFIQWSISFTFTRYPNENDFALLEYTLTPRLDLPTGIQYLTLAGRIQAPTEDAAQARLKLLQNMPGLIPANFALLDVQTSVATAGSESGLVTGSGGASDGLTFIELSFTVLYRDTGSLPATIEVTGGARINLGTIDKFREAVTSERYGERRKQRRYTGGSVTMSGKWYVADALSAADQQAALKAQKTLMDAQLDGGPEAEVVYAGIFDRVVRVTNFTCDIDRLTNVIGWQLTATYTRYPMETDYALLDYTLSPRVALPEGIAYLTLAGRIEAPTLAAAQARLALLQSAPGIVPAGYSLVNVQSSPRTVGSESQVVTTASQAQSDGLTFIELSFSVEYRATATLPATYKNLSNGGSSTFNLGTVDKFSEVTAVQRYDDMRDLRKRTSGTVTMSGHWYVLDSLTASNQQAQLAAQKALMDAQIVNGDRGQMTYGGIFNNTVRITNFKCDIDRVTNSIGWTMTFAYTKYPNEADYALLDYRLQRRLNGAEGIQYLTMTGKVQGPSEAACTARLFAQAAAIIPTNYVTLETDLSPATVVSESNAVSTGGQSQSDGTAFIEMTFTLSYRDVSSIACTFQRPAGTQVTLGTADKFTSRMVTTLYDEMRDVRKRAAGTVTVSGHWYAPDALSAGDKQATLLSQQKAFQAELVKGCSGLFNYGAAFNQNVRVVDADFPINRLNNCIDWSVTGTYTAYPNEADYAMADVKLGTAQNQADGTVIVTLTGMIAAQSPEAAQGKLVRLRAALIPSGYTLLADRGEERTVSSESGFLTTGQNQGDGDAFIELTVNDTWQKTTANILEWSLRTNMDGDARNPINRVTYSGTVRAVAATQPAAFIAAQLQAAILGDNKFPMQVRTMVTSLDKFFQTDGGQVFVTVEFSYEYWTQANYTYIEVTCTRNTDNYGATTDTVTGMVAAPSLAAAQVAYQNSVRALPAFTGALIMAERVPSLNQQILATGPTTTTSLDDRFDFSLTLLRANGAGSIKYDVQVAPNFNTLELATTVQGTVWGPSQVVAEAFLQTILTGLNLTGKKVNDLRTPRTRTGPGVGGSAVVSVFEAMDFTVTNIGLFTGVAGILETEVTAEILYSGQRLVEKPVPDGPSIIQQCGTTLGRRIINCRCVATTETAAAQWVRGIRTAMLASLQSPATVQAYEEPARIVTGYKFLPQVAGVPVGAGANVTVYEVRATFGEQIPELVFS